MKLIGIACDKYKANKFRRGLTKDGYAIEYDGVGPASGLHLFRIAVKDSEFADTKEKLKKTLKRLEIEVKRSN